MSLWDWSARAYGAAGVEGLCLALQDEDGQCVCLLLWAAWAAANGCIVGFGEMETAVRTARAWDDGALRPLRAARRALKQPSPGIDERGREVLRANVGAAELAAERLLLDGLEGLTPVGGGKAGDIEAALNRAALAWNGAAPRRLASLARAFPHG